MSYSKEVSVRSKSSRDATNTTWLLQKRLFPLNSSGTSASPTFSFPKLPRSPPSLPLLKNDKIFISNNVLKLYRFKISQPENRVTIPITSSPPTNSAFLLETPSCIPCIVPQPPPPLISCHPGRSNIDSMPQNLNPTTHNVDREGWKRRG